MADENNNNNGQNEQKKSTITGQVKNAGKSGAKKILKHLLKFLLPIVPILLIAMLFYALISLVVDFFQGLFEDIANFFTINLENGAYEIKDEEIDKVLEQLKDEYNLSAEELGLLGDIDYDKASEEEKKEAERKYIKLFLEAQQTTQTINTGVLGSNGSVYMMTPKISENTITKYPDYSILWDANNPIISREDFIKAVEDYNPPNGRGENNRSFRECYEKFFRNNAAEFYDISTAAGINPMIMVAIGTHESAYGSSNIANEKLNLWGWGAYDSSPGESAIDFDAEDIKEGISKGIQEIATSLKEDWATPGTWRYERIAGEGRDPTTLDGIGPLYCTTAGWSDLVKQHMLNIFGDKCKLGDSTGKYTILEHEKELEPMIFKKKADFEKIVENGGNFNELRKYYSIDENGKLMLINFNYTNDVPSLTIQYVDYKSMISQYTTSCMFFIDMAMSVQNPKFMEAFVEMVKDSRITLNVMYNSSSQTTTTTTYHYETKEVGNETVQELVSETSVVTQESYTPNIMISTAKTWIFSREAGFKKTIVGPQYYHSDEGVGEDRVVTDIESTMITYSEDTPKEEYNGGEKGEEGTFVGLLDKRFKIPNSPNRRSAGPDLVSNSVAFFEFLSRSSTTQSMENIMRYVLYKYTGEDYGVTEFDLSIFKDMSNVITGGAGKYWWPIGSSTTTTEDGKLFASGAPDVDTTITSGPGPRWGKYHKGIDIAPTSGGSVPGPYIIATADGVVIDTAGGTGPYYDVANASDAGGMGNYVKIKCGDLTITYMHMARGSITVSPGETVKQGQVIGRMGNSGHSTGMHLHFQINDAAGNVLDPEEYVSEDNPRPQSVAGTIYYQNDYANVSYGSSNIANCGCGPTAFAMVATDYTGKQITPADAVAWCGNAYYVNGAGTAWSYFNAAAKHFNLPCTVVDLGKDINRAVEELQKGNLVISSQGPGLFTSGGHFILLSSIENGGIKVRDPNKNNAVNKGYESRVFSTQEINQSASNYWAFVR